MVLIITKAARHEQQGPNLIYMEVHGKKERFQHSLKSHQKPYALCGLAVSVALCNAVDEIMYNLSSDLLSLSYDLKRGIL